MTIDRAEMARIRDSLQVLPSSQTERKDSRGTIAIKAKPDGGWVVHGYGSTFGPPADSYGDCITPGAFEKSLAANSRIYFLWAHNPAEPIGTLDAYEDDYGLFVSATMVKTHRAGEVATLIEEGLVGGLSIGYRVKDYHREGQVRWLDEVDLLEVSAVLWPANELARITSIGKSPERRAQELTVDVADVRQVYEQRKEMLAIKRRLEAARRAEMEEIRRRWAV